MGAQRLRRRKPAASKRVLGVTFRRPAFCDRQKRAKLAYLKFMKINSEKTLCHRPSKQPSPLFPN
jgi:hypothetical protein